MASRVELKMPPRSTATSIILDELGRGRGRLRIVGGAVLDEQLDVTAQEAAGRIEFVHHERRGVGLADAQDREGPVWSAMTPTLIASRMTSLLRLVVAAELRHLRPGLVPGLLQDRRDIGV